MSLLQGSNGEPLKKLSQPLTNTHSSVFVVPAERVANMKAIVITDQTFGKTLPLTKSIPHCLKNLMTIIARESVNCIFIIGDLVHFTESKEKEAKENLLKVLNAFEMIPLPIFIMAGDHNRRLLWETKYDKPGSNITIVYDFLIRITHPNPPLGTPANFYLTHDAKNPLSLKLDEIESYAVELKRAFNSEIANEDFLLIGHCQTYVLNETARVACIKEFSPDNHRNGYAIISVTPEGTKLNIVGK
ncbi:Ser/Thr protein phosphatase [Tritrichomonas foetus]|uniref:Ser/Thr protein phosphatase n=1 Tax=Tritrichomonas foetus TaxID=1144522 RepID=A0A1J4JXT5_9EUKA|nr:Ser/Thr protein phosphatase [Tritrichomonas foetus]|eukprot:OHT02077.1 Ser/Thr protein phosphatase [Tritrichomonas foetus]